MHGVWLGWTGGTDLGAMLVGEPAVLQGGSLYGPALQLMYIFPLS